MPFDRTGKMAVGALALALLAISMSSAYSATGITPANIQANNSPSSGQILAYYSDNSFTWASPSGVQVDNSTIRWTGDNKLEVKSITENKLDNIDSPQNGNVLTSQDNHFKWVDNSTFGGGGTDNDNMYLIDNNYKIRIENLENRPVSSGAQVFDNHTWGEYLSGEYEIVIPLTFTLIKQSAVQLISSCSSHYNGYPYETPWGTFAFLSSFETDLYAGDDFGQDMWYMDYCAVIFSYNYNATGWYGAITMSKSISLSAGTYTVLLVLYHPYYGMTIDVANISVLAVPT